MTDFETKTVEKLKEKFPDSLREIKEFRGQVTILADSSNLLEILEFLKTDSELDYAFLADITGVDRYQQAPRFELYYQLRSLTHVSIITLKIKVEDGEKVPSAVSLWEAANWLEREIYDLLGIEFTNHPDLRRIVTPDHWTLHPLRKDYPLRGVNEPLFPPDEDDI
jgi:NADH-quinone oxidoreductase subunit C